MFVKQPKPTLVCRFKNNQVTQITTY